MVIFHSIIIKKRGAFFYAARTDKIIDKSKKLGGNDYGRQNTTQKGAKIQRQIQSNGKNQSNHHS